jgi:hypothetical protein
VRRPRGRGWAQPGRRRGLGLRLRLGLGHVRAPWRARPCCSCQHRPTPPHLPLPSARTRRAAQPGARAVLQLLGRAYHGRRVGEAAQPAAGARVFPHAGAVPHRHPGRCAGAARGLVGRPAGAPTYSAPRRPRARRRAPGRLTQRAPSWLPAFPPTLQARPTPRSSATRPSRPTRPRSWWRPRCLASSSLSAPTPGGAARARGLGCLPSASSARPSARRPPRPPTSPTSSSPPPPLPLQPPILCSLYLRESLPEGVQEAEYEVLNILEFNSTRKRMSVVLRAPDNRILLYCKVRGARGRGLGPQWGAVGCQALPSDSKVVGLVCSLHRRPAGRRPRAPILTWRGRRPPARLPARPPRARTR